MNLAILALDLATTTGWALRARDGSVTSGVQRFDLARGESPGMRFLRLRRWLQELVESAPFMVGGVSLDVNERPRAQEATTKLVDVISYERAHHRGGAATAVCVGMATVMLEEAARLGIEVSPVATTTLKKHATGSGRAGKDEMIAAASKRWHSVYPSGVEDDNQADALCILAWACDGLGVRA